MPWTRSKTFDSHWSSFVAMPKVLEYDDGLTKQQRWAICQIARGNCIMCGKPHTAPYPRCTRCRSVLAANKRKVYHEARTR